MSFSHLFGQLIPLGISVPLFLSPLRLQGSETQVTRSGQTAFFPLLEHNFHLNCLYTLSDLLDNVGIPLLLWFYFMMREEQ